MKKKDLRFIIPHRLCIQKIRHITGGQLKIGAGMFVCWGPGMNLHPLLKYSLTQTKIVACIYMLANLQIIIISKSTRAIS